MSKSEDIYEDERFSGKCPTCGQEFLKEKAERAEASNRFINYALNRSIYDEDGRINYRVKFWHDLKLYYDTHPSPIDAAIFKAIERRENE